MSGINLQTKNLLASSVELYRELLLHAENLMKMLDRCDYSRIHEHAGGLQRLQDAACKQDDVLLPLLKAELPNWEKHTMYQQRHHLIKSIIELNELLLPKISASMAVTSAELHQIRGSRTALTGYGSQASNRRSDRGIG